MQSNEMLRKQALYADIIILVNNLNDCSDHFLGRAVMIPPTQEMIDKASVESLEALKRKLREFHKTMVRTRQPDGSGTQCSRLIA